MFEKGCVPEFDTIKKLWTAIQSNRAPKDFKLSIDPFFKAVLRVVNAKKLASEKAVAFEAALSSIIPFGEIQTSSCDGEKKVLFTVCIIELYIQLCDWVSSSSDLYFLVFLSLVSDLEAWGQNLAVLYKENPSIQKDEEILTEVKNLVVRYREDDQCERKKVADHFGLLKSLERKIFLLDKVNDCLTTPEHLLLFYQVAWQYAETLNTLSSVKVCIQKRERGQGISLSEVIAAYHKALFCLDKKLQIETEENPCLDPACNPEGFYLLRYSDADKLALDQVNMALAQCYMKDGNIKKALLYATQLMNVVSGDVICFYNKLSKVATFSDLSEKSLSHLKYINMVLGLDAKKKRRDRDSLTKYQEKKAGPPLYYCQKYPSIFGRRTPFHPKPTSGNVTNPPHPQRELIPMSASDLGSSISFSSKPKIGFKPI